MPERHCGILRVCGLHGEKRGQKPLCQGCIVSVKFENNENIVNRIADLSVWKWLYIIWRWCRIRMKSRSSVSPANTIMSMGNFSVVINWERERVRKGGSTCVYFLNFSQWTLAQDERTVNVEIHFLKWKTGSVYKWKITDFGRLVCEQDLRNSGEQAVLSKRFVEKERKVRENTNEYLINPDMST